jgi:hypothetical protein
MNASLRVLIVEAEEHVIDSETIIRSLGLIRMYFGGAKESCVDERKCFRHFGIAISTFFVECRSTWLW